MYNRELLDLISNIPVSEVLSKRMSISRKRSRHQYGLCPFHSDTKEGSFVITDDKGMWECFTCRVGGNSIKFISLFDNLDYLDAAVQIALEFGIITLKQSLDLLNRKEETTRNFRSIERKYNQKTKPENVLANPDILNAVYRIFIRHAGISVDHTDYLMNKRHLSSEDIEDTLYFSYPTRRILRNFMSDIRRQFGSEEILGSIPGFFWIIENKRFTFRKSKGLGIPIHNARGLIVGIQIRLDDELDPIQRYIWLSSSFTSYDDRFSKGTSPGAPPDIHYPKELLTSTVYLTEGHFKAKKISKTLGAIAVSVQGVGSQRGVLEALQEIPSEVIKRELCPNFKIDGTFLAFDADLAYNIRVYEQLKKLSDAMVLNGFSIYYLYWPESVGKGIDDVIDFGSYSENINAYDKTIWDKAYLAMEDELREKENENIYKIPQTVVAQYFPMVLSMVTPARLGVDFMPPSNPVTILPDTIPDNSPIDPIELKEINPDPSTLSEHNTTTLQHEPAWRKLFHKVIMKCFKKTC